MNVANGFWLPLLRLRGIRTVVNVDGIEWHRDKWSKSGKWMFKAGAWLTARFAHELIFDAEAIGDYWRRRLHRDGVFIPYGADEYPPILFREEFEPHQYALLVARFVPENSVPQFIEAARIIAESHDVVLVGSTSEGQELYQLASAANQHPRIHWLGHVSDDRRLFSLWQNAGAYFHGHTVGGTNPALVQAMALGTKIVARDTVYNREVLGVDGDFCSGDPSEIASKVLALIEKGPVSDSPLRHRAREVYNWAGVCRDYENVLSAQASASRRAPSTSSAR
jgi:glycosyltransferase involved in cell wall biosynthesis